MARYGIAEWFGIPYLAMTGSDRQAMARAALRKTDPPPCPFQAGSPSCRKRGGVCSIREGDAPPVIVCPQRFSAGNLLPKWLADITGFPEVYLATEVPFMRSPSTGRAAGRIDLVVARDGAASAWFGLEVQAVYFSGDGMDAEFRAILNHDGEHAPAPKGVRRPDWRSSSAKRLMPQLQVKGPTLRRWGTKLAVAVDLPFYEAIGGVAIAQSTDPNDGDIIWMVSRIDEEFNLVPCYWEVLSLEDSCEKLLSAETCPLPTNIVTAKGEGFR